MDYPNLGEFSLRNVTQNNIILGKNGCGKSFLLKNIEQPLRQQTNTGVVRYISPERAGFLVYESGVDQAISNQANWMDNNRRQNQSQNFKQQSVILYRRLEHLTLLEIEREHTEPGYTPKTFQTVIDKINTLLDRVKIIRSESSFEIVEIIGGAKASAEQISSGESQLVSLAIEFLAFASECKSDKQNYLLIDEPDVHLHPDLQHRLAKFLATEVNKEYITTIIATHSTSILSALASESCTRIAFMKRGDKEIKFVDTTEVYKRILPMFGAHPLSNIFNEAPILLLEGGDDHRIWQQVVRTSVGEIKVFPCVADSIEQLNEFEKDADQIIGAVYDGARGLSLRDRDENPESIDNQGAIIRMRLSCRAAENLMLSDDVLVASGTNWVQLQGFISQFVNESTTHPCHSFMKTFVEGGSNRKTADLKEIRTILLSFISKKPWEVLVGQSIATMKKTGGLVGADSLKAYLGEKVCREICQMSYT